MLKYYDFSGASFLVDKRFECENASENAAARFDLVHNPTVPYLTDSTVNSPLSQPPLGVAYRGVLVFDCTRQQVYNLGNGGVPVHHDPVDGIVTNHEK